jgi:uncharacterized membrane protein YqhA
MSMAPETPLPPPGTRLRPLPMLIFGSRWLQLPLYVGLIIAQVVYVVLFVKELLVMVIVGGYETFVSRLNLEGHPDEPEWLSHVNASVLKIKLAMAIIGISSIHLLRTFIEAGNLGSGRTNYTETGVMWQSIIHGLFIVSAIGIAYVEKISSGSEQAAHAAKQARH